MIRRRLVRKFVAASATSAIAFAAVRSEAQAAPTQWSFAVSGDSRNCGDFVMPAIAAKVKAERDVFYWHLGDFRWISEPDQDLIAMEHAGSPFSKEPYQKVAWDDFLAHQIASFSPVPVFLARGNHETVKPMTREGYIDKFSRLLDRPEIEAQRQTDGANAAPIGHATELTSSLSITRATMNSQMRSFGGFAACSIMI